MCCLSFFDLRLLFTPLVSSNFSYTKMLIFTKLLSSSSLNADKKEVRKNVKNIFFINV